MTPRRRVLHCGVAAPLCSSSWQTEWHECCSSLRAQEIHMTANNIRTNGTEIATIAIQTLSHVTGGTADFTFQGKGIATKDACLGTIGRGIAHGFGATGPWKPGSAMRPNDHLILDKQRNEVGAATWTPVGDGLWGKCDVAIY